MNVKDLRNVERVQELVGEAQTLLYNLGATMKVKHSDTLPIRDRLGMAFNKLEKIISIGRSE